MVLFNALVCFFLVNAFVRGDLSLGNTLSGGAICENGMSICSTTSTMCISDDKFCDNHVDCDDGMDEVGCYPPSLAQLTRPHESQTTRSDHSRYVDCSTGTFMCEDRNCILLSDVCNGRRDCIGGRDEYGCNSHVTSTRPPYSEQFTTRPRNTHDATSRSSYDGRNYETTSETPRVKISIYDSEQTVTVGNDVVFRCRDESLLRAPVYWSRANDGPLPSNAHDLNGRLTVTKVTRENEGEYHCKAAGHADRRAARLIIAGVRSDARQEATTRQWSGETSTDMRSSAPSTNGYDYTTSVTTAGRLAMLQRAKRMRDCQSGYISCADGSTCIHRRQMCDGRVECYDGSDEKGCRVNCTNHRFTCGTQCLDKSKRCDGIVQCHDATDEFLCQNECSIDSYWCPGTQECIPHIYRCDGEYDCPDGADEKECEKPRMIAQPEKMYSVEKGKSITLTCRASGTPKPRIEWRFNLERIPDTSTSISVCTTCHNCSENEALSSLTVAKFDERYEGKWTCEAVNSVDRQLAPHDTDLTLRPASPYVSGRVYHK